MMETRLDSQCVKSLRDRPIIHMGSLTSNNETTAWTANSGPSIIIINFGRSRSIVLVTNLNLLSVFFKFSLTSYSFSLPILYSLLILFNPFYFQLHSTPYRICFLQKPVKPTLKTNDAGHPNHLLRQTVPQIHNTLKFDLKLLWLFFCNVHPFPIKGRKCEGPKIRGFVNASVR